MFKLSDTEYSICSSLFFGIDLLGDIQVNLVRAIKDWCLMMEQNKQHNKNLNVRIF